GDFSGEASGAGVLVEDDHFIGLLHRLSDGFAVDGDQGAQVEDFEIDPFVFQNVCGFKGCVDHSGIGDDAEVPAIPCDTRLPDGDYIIVLRHFFFYATVEIFVFEKDAGIIVANGGFDQAFGVIGGGWADDLQAGIVDEPHLGILRVEGAAVDVSTAGAAQDERGWRAPEIVSLGHHVADLVEGAADEIHELKFGDWTHSGERRSESRAYDGGFG